MIKQEDKQSFFNKLEELKKQKKFIVVCEKCNGTGVSFQKRGSGNNTFKKCGICSGKGTINKNDYTLKSIAAMDLFYKGYTRGEIIEFLVQHCGDTEGSATVYVSKAFYFVEHEHLMKKNDVLAIHYKRYEEIYRRNNEIEPEDIPAKFRAMRMFEVVTSMIETLQAKERAFGMHAKNFSIIVNQYRLAKKRSSSRNQYDLKKLPIEKLLEIKSMIETAKQRNNTPTVYKDTVEDEANKMNTFAVSTKEFEYDSPIRKVNIIKKENSLESKQGSTLDDVKNKMNEAFKLRIKESMKKS